MIMKFVPAVEEARISKQTPNCISLCPVDGNLGVMGDTRHFLWRPTLGHHPVHTGGAAGAGLANISHVEGMVQAQKWLGMHYGKFNYPSDTLMG